MNVTPLFFAVRAVGSEFARRVYLPAVWIVGGILLAVLFVSGWLTTINLWWSLLLAPVIICVIVFIIAAAVAGVVINMLRPVQTKDQRRAVSRLVDKLQNVSDILQTPKPLLLVQLVKDILFPSGEGLIGSTTSDALMLTPDFRAIVTSFK